MEDQEESSSLLKSSWREESTALCGHSRVISRLSLNEQLRSLQEAPQYLHLVT